MTWNSEDETTRLPVATGTSDATGPQPTREYVWPEPERESAQRTVATAVGGTAPGHSPSGPTSALGSVEPEREPARRKGNRLAGLALALLTTAVFAALHLVALTAIRILVDRRTGDPLALALAEASTPVFLAPVVVFFTALALIVLVVNRAGWWAYVLGGFLVAVLTAAAALVGAWYAVGGLAVPTDRTQLVDFLRDPAVLLAVLSAGVLGREVSVWGGAMIAGRARRVKRRNAAREAAATS